MGGVGAANAVALPLLGRGRCPCLVEVQQPTGGDSFDLFPPPPAAAACDDQQMIARLVSFEILPLVPSIDVLQDGRRDAPKV